MSLIANFLQKKFYVCNAYLKFLSNRDFCLMKSVSDIFKWSNLIHLKYTFRKTCPVLASGLRVCLWMGGGVLTFELPCLSRSIFRWCHKLSFLTSFLKCKILICNPPWFFLSLAPTISSLWAFSLCFSAASSKINRWSKDMVFLRTEYNGL